MILNQVQNPFRLTGIFPFEDFRSCLIREIIFNISFALLMLVDKLLPSNLFEEIVIGHLTALFLLHSGSATSRRRKTTVALFLWLSCTQLPHVDKCEVFDLCSQIEPKGLTWKGIIDDFKKTPEDIIEISKQPKLGNYLSAREVLFFVVLVGKIWFRPFVSNSEDIWINFTAFCHFCRPVRTFDKRCLDCRFQFYPLSSIFL